MDSMISRQTQQDNAVIGVTGVFRVKLNVKYIICAARPGHIGEYQVRTRVGLRAARGMARLFVDGPEARTLRALGLEP